MFKPDQKTSATSDCVQSCDAAGSYGVHSQFIVVNFLFWSLVTGYTASTQNWIRVQTQNHIYLYYIYILL